MRIPGAERALVDPAKVREYLLSPIHPVGRFKARFFATLGYTGENWLRLLADLSRIALSGDANPVAVGGSVKSSRRVLVSKDQMGGAR